jgi:hypothetical protein
MPHVNQSEQIESPADPNQVAEDVPTIGWVRWWHILIVAALLAAGFVYYPMWRFELRWKTLQAGATVDEMQEILGEPPEPSYHVSAPGGSYDAYIYRRYWKSYEVLVDTPTQRVAAKAQMP